MHERECSKRESEIRQSLVNNRAALRKYLEEVRPHIPPLAFALLEDAQSHLFQAINSLRLSSTTRSDASMEEHLLQAKELTRVSSG